MITIFSIPSGQSVSLDSAYHSLNRTILFQLSRPLARLTGEKVNNCRHKQLLEIFTLLCEYDRHVDRHAPVVREHSCEPVWFSWRANHSLVAVVNFLRFFFLRRCMLILTKTSLNTSTMAVMLLRRVQEHFLVDLVCQCFTANLWPHLVINLVFRSSHLLSSTDPLRFFFLQH